MGDKSDGKHVYLIIVSIGAKGADVFIYATWEKMKTNASFIEATKVT